MCLLHQTLFFSTLWKKPKKVTIWKTWLFGKTRRKPMPRLGVGDLPLSN